MNRETARSLLDALDVCSEIEELTRSVPLERFKAQRLLYLSIERLFEIAGEAFTRARRFDTPLVESISESRCTTSHHSSAHSTSYSECTDI